jgi:hypothetical protein
VIFNVPTKPCCGGVILLGEECDCLQFAASAERLFASPLTLPTTAAGSPEPVSTTYPTPLILRNVGGLLRPVEATP